ncbi:hypothetical protein TNCV_124641 [Trichonephila clavipes]|nr:hypothetical protein TNCV_124641 [Trichonephila clavipes]
MGSAERQQFKRAESDRSGKRTKHQRMRRIDGMREEWMYKGSERVRKKDCDLCGGCCCVPLVAIEIAFWRVLFEVPSAKRTRKTAKSAESGFGASELSRLGGELPRVNYDLIYIVDENVVMKAKYPFANPLCYYIF